MENKQLGKVIAIMETIMEWYDPENDVIPGGPKVTVTELKLAEMVGILANEIMDLKKKVKGD